MPHQPIRAFVEGLDGGPRNLNDEEIDGLTDWFGQWLARTPEADRQTSLRSFLNDALPANCWKPFGLADGLSIVYDHTNPDNPLNEVSRLMRFVIIALPDNEPSLIPLSDVTLAIMRRTLCIVASSNVDGDGDANDAFLQCASWDPNARGPNLGMMRFYERSGNGWTYFGDGLNAFNENSAGKGPFDGHVGGSMIMKELTQPWIHWYDQSNAHDFEASLGSTKDTPSLCDPHNVLHDPLFTDGAPFSRLGRAEDLELVVKNSVLKWYNTRFAHDFLDEHRNPLQQTTAVRSWMEHLISSRAMNIAAASTASSQVAATGQIVGIPTTLFYNSHAFQPLLPDVGNFQGAGYNITAANDYHSGIQALGLGLYYDDWNEDTETSELKLAVALTEGPFPFPIIESGIEDYQAIRKLATAVKPVLFPKKAMAALLMVDFRNPIYSHRRESLMKYVPANATLKEDGITYNVLEQFMEKLQAPALADPNGPEEEFLSLMRTADGSWVNEFTTKVNTYAAKVAERLTQDSDADRRAAVQEYMVLADTKRRIFKGRENENPTGGLDEFALTLPRTRTLVPLPLVHMDDDDGNVAPMPPAAREHVKKIIKLKRDALSKYANISGGCTAYQRRINAGVCPKLFGHKTKQKHY